MHCSTIWELRTLASCQLHEVRFWVLLCRDGRQLIYALSAKHHNCLLLNYAIQKILRQGHEDEVASIGSSLASYFGVFHRLLANRLREVPSASVARLRQISTELRVSKTWHDCDMNNQFDFTTFGYLKSVRPSLCNRGKWHRSEIPLCETSTMLWSYK